MNAAVLNNFAAAEFLANGNGFYRKTIVLTNVSWDEYERFLEAFDERGGWHLAYDEGKLEIMPPLAEHEKPSRTIDALAMVYCDVFDLTIESVGSTTFRRKSKSKGIEPDACFYLQSADKIIGKIEQLKPDSYPVPDVAVEIDVTHGSLDKFPIYAALGVPELWIYDGEKVRIYQLAGDEYNQTEQSAAFSRLSAEKLTDFLEQSKTKGQTAALKSFRQWLRQAAE